MMEADQVVKRHSVQLPLLQSFSSLVYFAFLWITLKNVDLILSYDIILSSHLSEYLCQLSYPFSKI